MPKISCALRNLICLVAGALIVSTAPSQSDASEGDSPHYNGDSGGMHYSALTQIGRSNVAKLKEVWRYDVAQGRMDNTPIVVDGILYGAAAGRYFALDAATGDEKWTFTPTGQKGRGAFVSRGESWWTDGKESRLLVTASNLVYSLDPVTGRPDPKFGKGGYIDLNDNLRGPASANNVRMGGPVTIYKSMFFTCGGVGEQTPSSPGDIRAWDVRTGKLIWTFHTIPHPGEPGAETWPPGAHFNAGGANAWPGMVLDDKRGILFAGTGSPSDDFYGGERPGKNLYGNSLLALDTATGKLLWHFQAIHHDLWDYDFSSPPILVTVRRNGRTIDAVAATNKTSYIYVFDRVTGKPLFPIEERPAPATSVPGDTAWPTQPHPLLPPPLSRQSVNAEELTQRTPEANAWAREKFARFVNGPMFTPPAYNRETVVAPGFSGGNEWGGMTFDPNLQLLFVNTQNIVWTTAVMDRFFFCFAL